MKRSTTMKQAFLLAVLTALLSSHDLRSNRSDRRVGRAPPVANRGTAPT